MTGDDWDGSGEIVPTNGTAIKPAAESSIAPYDGLDAGMVSDWARSGGEDYHLGQVQGAVLAVLNEVDATDRQDIEAGFEALPSAAQTAILTELSLPGGGSARTASEADLARFEASPEGAVLVPFWRGRAGRNLGLVKQRLSRIDASMSESDKTAAWSWFEALPTRAAVAIYCVLAS